MVYTPSRPQASRGCTLAVAVLFGWKPFATPSPKKGGNLELREVPCGEGPGRLLAPTLLFPGRIQARGWKSKRPEPEQATELGVLLNSVSWLLHAAAITHDEWAWGVGGRDG